MYTKTLFETASKNSTVPATYSSLSRTQSERFRYGSAGEHGGYGSEDKYHYGSYYDDDHGAHSHDRNGYSQGEKASKSSKYATSASGGDHSSGGHHEEDASKYTGSASDYGKDAKTKSYGFFDYKYVQPQYHVEKFHSDEKHAKKYGSSAHEAEAKDRSDGDYYSKGHDGYYGDHGQHESRHGHYSKKDGARGFEKKGHHSGYGSHEGGQHHYGHKGHDEGYKYYMYSPRGGHHEYEPPYYGHDSYYGHDGHDAHDDYHGRGTHHSSYGNEYSPYY
ncbi:unnamed protein product [Heligmosomoides polygyrus]|uniref:Filaggrin-2-like n=1 Tax=Heligmosomoides polygyrus TaxID=6339 RepID=A0A183FYK7_HELPZ|nr:unnamed protein product [Heligmosomoides polygyrus]